MSTSTDAQPTSIEEKAVSTLLEVVKAASSPDVVQAQAMLLRRLALEGDVVGSRIPAPQNITQIGGYLNLLGDLAEPAMREQMLAGILGVSGPNPQLGWLPAQPPLSWTTLPNDRPAGPSQPATPLSITVRSDMAPAVQAAQKQCHDSGCALPLVTPAPSLPPALVGVTPPPDVLAVLGRTLQIVPTAALVDPDTDPVALARTGGDPFALVLRVLSAGSVAVTPQPWDALRCDATTSTIVPAPSAGRSYVPLGPILAAAGFYPASPGFVPANNTDTSWSRCTNVTGLIPGSTRLGDELSLLYTSQDIAASAFAGRASWTWDGTQFSAGTA